MIIDLGVFHSAIEDLNGAVTFMLIFALFYSFSMQIVSWVTKPGPNVIRSLAIGLIPSVFGVFVFYNFIPLGPALIRASISGAYGNWGYFWVTSMVFLVLIFVVNGVNSWKENRPLELIQ